MTKQKYTVLYTGPDADLRKGVHILSVYPQLGTTVEMKNGVVDIETAHPDLLVRRFGKPGSEFTIRQHGTAPQAPKPPNVPPHNSTEPEVPPAPKVVVPPNPKVIGKPKPAVVPLPKAPKVKKGSKSKSKATTKKK